MATRVVNTTGRAETVLGAQSGFLYGFPTQIVDRVSDDREIDNSLVKRPGSKSMNQIKIWLGRFWNVGIRVFKSRRIRRSDQEDRRREPLTVHIPRTTAGPELVADAIVMQHRQHRLQRAHNVGRSVVGEVGSEHDSSSRHEDSLTGYDADPLSAPTASTEAGTSVDGDTVRDGTDTAPGSDSPVEQSAATGAAASARPHRSPTKNAGAA